MIERGVFRHDARSRQLLRFDGCGIAGTNITPTDIDACIEYHDKCWIVIEVKTVGVNIPTGQEILIKRMVLDGVKAGKKNLGIFALHSAMNPDDDIMLRECTVKTVYFFDPYKHTLTVKDISARNITVPECVMKWISFIDQTPM